MRKASGLPLFFCFAAAACDSPTAATRPDVNTPSTASASAGGVALAVNGAGHVLRDLGAGPELTTFSYNAIRREDGTTSGQYQFNFRALNLVVHGTVTCVTATGNVAWVGGVIDDLHSDDPADQELVGTDIWWRVTDRGEGFEDSADLTTSLLFTIPGNPTTAQSWCNDKPTRGVERPIIAGNIQVKVD
jgi:hypothetical protein